MGIKKYAPYREKKQEGWDRNRNTRLTELKDKLTGRRWGVNAYGDRSAEAGPSGEEKPKKRKGKKERMKLKTAVGDADAGPAVDGGDEQGGDVVGVQASGSSTKKRKAAREGDEGPQQEAQLSEGPSKKRRRRHKKSGGAQES